MPAAASGTSGVTVRSKIMGNGSTTHSPAAVQPTAAPSRRVVKSHSATTRSAPARTCAARAATIESNGSAIAAAIIQAWSGLPSPAPRVSEPSSTRSARHRPEPFVAVERQQAKRRQSQREEGEQEQTETERSPHAAARL